VASRLVRTYGELRQAEQLLASLAGAAARGSCPEAAARVVGRPAFSEALLRVRCCTLQRYLLWITITSPHV
jgi:hypothetical protein